MSEIIVVSTPDLRLGDIVHNYGMRIVLDTEASVFEGTTSGQTWSWVGTVTNADEVVSANRVPRSYLTDDVWVDGQGWTRVQTNRWNVQGNHLASWRVER